MELLSLLFGTENCGVREIQTTTTTTTEEEIFLSSLGSWHRLEDFSLSLSHLSFSQQTCVCLGVFVRCVSEKTKHWLGETGGVAHSPNCAPDQVLLFYSCFGVVGYVVAKFNILVKV